jgi:hypothetical protein
MSKALHRPRNLQPALRSSLDLSRFDAACLMNIPAFVRNKSQSSTFKILSSGGGWIVCRLVFEDRKGVRSTITFAKGLNH